ncbi:MAG: hypothetical protein D6714_00305 [Bacteroidetes bacterium]|nr:MAG: hypothetical protein D6714_00305 [Bacteroidota bacterium]
MNEIIELLTNTEGAIFHFLQTYGEVTYLILFLIIFSETGLIVFPFLPGDGLLLTVGVIAASGALHIGILLPLLIVAAILGNLVNYCVGRYTGKRILRYKHPLLQKYVSKAHDFFGKYGATAVMASRFFPIVRTYVPFVAGVSEMPWTQFQKYNVLGGTLWVLIFTGGGYWLGGIPVMRENFPLIFGIVMVLTIVPLLYKIATRLLRKVFA